MTVFRRRLALLLLALAAGPVTARAQEGPAASGITGRVVGENAAPVAGAAVSARREADTATVARGVSGADGRFRLPGLAPGRYRVRAAHTGRQVVSGPVAVAPGGMADAGDLRLPAALVLEGLQVRAERPPVVHAEDRNIYSVKDMPTAIGGAADVMRTLPELEVDIEGRIRMVGNREVTIHINGRPSPLKGEALAEFIRNLPADRIDRIEVISNPSVRFEGGNAAIVNIVLRRGTELGLSGSVSLNAANRGGSGVSGQLAYQRGRLTLFGGGSSRLWRFDDRSRELRQNLRADPVTFLDQDRRNDGRNSHGSVDLTAELEVGPKETLWASASGYGGGWGGDGISHNRLLDADSLPTRVYDRVTRDGLDFLSSDLALGFRRIVEAQRHELSVELRRSGSGSDRTGRFLETTTEWTGDEGGPLDELRLTDGGEDETTLTAKADLTRPLGRKGRLEVGVRSSREDQSTESRLQVFPGPDAGDPALVERDDYTYRERQHSAYANLSHRVGRLSLQGGLRAERTTLGLEPGAEAGQPGFERDFLSVFPSANLNFQLREGRDLRLTYSRRVRRPWIWDLNPFVQQTDPLNLRLGNPDLEPSETHSLGMDLSLRDRRVMLRLAPYLRRTSGEIEHIRTVDAAGVATSMPRNIASVRSFGTTLNASLRPAPWGTASATVGVGHDERDGGALGSAYSTSGTTHFVSANTTLRPGRGVGLQASFRLSSPRETAQGRFSSTASTEVGIRKELFGDRSSLSVRVTDPLGIYRSTFVSRDPSFAGSGRSRSSWGSRSVSASFTYRFGRAPQRKSTENEGAPPVGGAGPS